MACSDYGSLTEALQAFQFHDAIACLYTDSAGTAVTGMFVFGAIATAVAFRTKSITMPVVLTLLTCAVLLPFMPGAASTIAVMILLFAVGVGPVLYIKRLNR